ncbi:glucose-6-phosphate 1-dehydrogenase [Alkalihalobacillus alcalophilus ATCC 27647 = CGMCC 1.3604]|uniref:Glucose-6-phosphate 1-dehydrogenase n=1 Tax=Alkalihalobacillus alcalophilus ATCC 27647 = CGMCC 1.3604 TaxID=1218173 RepID=A0A094WLS9_ALKAL|nr:glucose-6-phosphate dehydrogenase [Alkalihalobacillus alcalophilus]KGA98704.1 glucose-6-phosphate dehydrogenase [Alkalihalobacillus alcalophilus ATCC 27647 = CGMCC 1.3604]MED1560331.1 glucose-6-phosphate dehydrogenase [Alkalihalobacillus alcalophilus]THG89776.1 glucose-6-phosphate 1-dehydrogenase [Alkalihalobacillus alcalophilus ATCC 27647 = CGMCC 1.3604]
MTNKIVQPKTSIILFGATGDLAKRKLYPSIYSLFLSGKLSDNFVVIGAARRPWSDAELRENVKKAIEETHLSNERIDEFCQHFFYLPFDVTNTESYLKLKHKLEELEAKFEIPGNRIYYMAMAPQFFGTIAIQLKKEGVTQSEGWNRLVIEKPFGHDLPSAQKLNNEIREAFSEDQIYRIDHYLGKEMVQNIEVIRFANAIFEPLWNNRHISNIQITSSEVLGVEDRGGYYETSGALRDMVQNHLLQMVLLLSMDPPIRLATNEVRSEKIKVLRAIRPISTDEASDYFIRGQYAAGEISGSEVPGYRQEKNVKEDSTTETFVAGKLLIDNHRWAGVPFYVRTGKRMAVKSTKIVVQFKDLPLNVYTQKSEDMTIHPNLLVIHIQPDEGITLILNGKKVGLLGETIPVDLEFKNNSIDGVNTPEAYERLIYDCMLGDATNFAHWDEVNLSWALIDPISKAWAESNEEIEQYVSGTMGPKSSEQLLSNDGFKWWALKDL